MFILYCAGGDHPGPSFPGGCSALLSSLQTTQGLLGRGAEGHPALVGLCSLDIQGDGYHYTRDPNALSPFCALHAILAVFQV